MFRSIAILSFSLMTTIAVYVIVTASRRGGSAGLPAVLRIFTEKYQIRPLAAVRKTFFRIICVSLLLLVLSGFAQVVLAGRHMSGILLILHLAAAPIFAVSLLGYALISAQTNRLQESDLQALRSIFSRNKTKVNDNMWQAPYLKIFFWLMLFLGAITITTTALSMLPLFGTEGQVLLLQLHRYAALLFVWVVFFQLWLFIMAQAQAQANGKKQSAAKPIVQDSAHDA